MRRAKPPAQAPSLVARCWKTLLSPRNLERKASFFWLTKPKRKRSPNLLATASRAERNRSKVTILSNLNEPLLRTPSNGSQQNSTSLPDARSLLGGRRMPLDEDYPAAPAEPRSCVTVPSMATGNVSKSKSSNKGNASQRMDELVQAAINESKSVKSTIPYLYCQRTKLRILKTTLVNFTKCAHSNQSRQY